jgi:transposase
MTTVAKKLAAIKPGSLLAGVDLGLDSLVVVVLDMEGRRVERFKTEHNRDGYAYLSNRLRRLVQPPTENALWIGMEPTNYYWKLLATYLVQQGLPFRLVNPLTVNRHREGDQLDRAKDDWRDAFVIADLLRTGKFTETQLRAGAYAELQLGHATYWRLRLDRGRQLTRLTNSLRQIFPELSHVFKDLTGVTAQAVIRGGPAAAQIRTLSWKEFLSRVRTVASGHRLAISRLHQLHALAPNSIGVTQGVEALCFDVQSSLAHVQLLDQQTQTLLARLRQVFNGLPEAPFLRSIEGLGEISALGILAETGPLALYSSGKDLIKLAGTQPTPKASGRARRSKTPFSKQGRSRLRLVLYWATLRLLSRNAALAHHYRRLQQRAHRPLTKMEAVGACMNKLLWYVWHVGHKHELYDPGFWRRVGQRRLPPQRSADDRNRANRRLTRERRAAPAAAVKGGARLWRRPAGMRSVSGAPLTARRAAQARPAAGGSLA